MALRSPFAPGGMGEQAATALEATTRRVALEQVALEVEVEQIATLARFIQS